MDWINRHEIGQGHPFPIRDGRLRAGEGKAEQNQDRLTEKPDSGPSRPTLSENRRTVFHTYLSFEINKCWEFWL
jgi:hypothetical protein